MSEKNELSTPESIECTKAGQALADSAEIPTVDTPEWPDGVIRLEPPRLNKP